jgi:hypothetical protein
VKTALSKIGHPRPDDVHLIHELMLEAFLEVCEKPRRQSPRNAATSYLAARSLTTALPIGAGRTNNDDFHVGLHFIELVLLAIAGK